MADPVTLLAAATAASSGSVGFGGLTSLGSFATFGSYALIGGAAVGGGILLNALSKQHSSEQQTVKQSVPARSRTYGRNLVGGSYFFFAATATTLVSGFALAEGPIDAIELHFLGDTPVLPSQLAGLVYEWPWNGHIYISGQLGGANQPYQAIIQQNFPYWGPTHRNRGIANSVLTFTLPDDPDKNFGKFFPSGAPPYRAQIRGAQVFDPRAGQSWDDPNTWVWSRNPALCVLDYMTSTRGMGLPQTRLDLASFAAMADLCDSIVTYSDGSTERRYLLDGTYTLDEAPKDVLARMLQTCDGELYPLANGTIGMRGGQWSPPTFTVTPDMILTCDAKRGVDKLASFNELKVRYIDEDEYFQLTEGPPFDDVDAQVRAGEVLPQDFSLQMVHHYGQARRLAQIAMAKGNPEWLLDMTLSIAALQMLGERIVTVNQPDLAINSTFFVNAFSIAADGATCTASLGALTADAYSDVSVGVPTPPPASTRLGPIEQALLVGADMDWGLDTDAPIQTDDFGSVTDDSIVAIDMGALT